jgi:hypothetical protein
VTEGSAAAARIDLRVERSGPASASGGDALTLWPPTPPRPPGVGAGAQGAAQPALRQRQQGHDRARVGRDDAALPVHHEQPHHGGWDARAGQWEKGPGLCRRERRQPTVVAAGRAAPCPRAAGPPKLPPAPPTPAVTPHPPQPRAQVITQVKWGGEGLIYSASRDCSINVWDADGGKLVRTLKGHAHWVNTLALSSEYALRTGAHDHRGSAPADVDEARAVRLPRGPARRGRGRGAGWGAGAVKRGAPCPLAVRPTHPLDHLAPTAPQKNRPPRSGTTRRPAAAPSAWSAAATTSRCFCGRLLLVRPTSRG